MLRSQEIRAASFWGFATRAMGESEMKSYTLEEYRKYIYPISLEDLMTIDDPKEFGRRLAEECGILYNLA